MITLVLGGASSGKSLAAEGIAGSYGAQVTYVATAVPLPGDADHVARIGAHRARRPSDWTTVECTAVSDLARRLRQIGGAALVDSLGTWVTLQPEFDVSAETDDLLAALAERDAPTVLVSEEVGLADSADGLGAQVERARRLELMAEPGIGAFALAAGGTVLVSRWALLADPDIEFLAFVGVWAASRILAATVPAFVGYARPGGLAEAFCAGSCRWLLAWLAPVAAGLFFVTGALGPIAVGAAVVTCVGIVVLAKRRLGGFTGDVLGAVIMLSETAALLTLVAAP